MSVRTLAAQLFFAAVVIAQAYFVVAAYDNPHSHFGYQPFSQSSTWSAHIVRVTYDGQRHDIRDGWEGYHWPTLVRARRGLDWPFDTHNAHSGVESTLDFFQKALDWVALNTPNDRTTRYLEARVHYVKNAHEPVEVTLRSVERPR